MTRFSAPEPGAVSGGLFAASHDERAWTRQLGAPRELAHATLGVDVELAALRPGVDAVREAGALREATALAPPHDACTLDQT
jgi:hypothetical protein